MSRRAALTLLSLLLGPVLLWPAPAAGDGDPEPVGQPAGWSGGWSAPPSRQTTAVGEWPLRPEPEVVRRFDPPSSPWGRGHRGVDLAGHVGQVVRTALPGRVSYAARLAGRGVVVVDHGDTRTTYEPVVADVEVGQRVAGGERLGRLEAVGSHCPPQACLHWGWIRGEDYLDPLRLVGLGPVRLLPLAGSARSPTARPGSPCQARGWACW